MNKKSKVLQQRNASIQAKYAKELAKTTNKSSSILSIYTILALEFDLSVERVREIVCGRRI